MKKYLIILILLTGCSHIDDKFNPATTIIKHIIKGENK
jgi:hypothetical protein|tara:strand:- start:332 stop:445 length:114 start_codon:yes stop_codon:yes gene_type:complete